MGDVAREAELEKAGIYNHFSGKEDLALAAFDFSTGIMRRRFEKALEGEEGVLVRLLAIVDEFGRLIEVRRWRADARCSTQPWSPTTPTRR